ncbi:hypothetical protein [Dehalococcoides mccartyi]|uniref:hypothetical protein n=1 Tax=Dehalococcoides mccartyi TaxID=61435 RepID=UPI0006BD071B|nr:hypothetical protein [Dehalococcoides mccartyi]BAS32094.1 hypothetical protein IBK_1051 [Dehalococcoides mccartyi IBARAKI]BEL01155.1 hypothetical protein DMOBY_10080 [Dehalococcoides mccartyi]
MPETMPIVYCFACLQVALASSEETKDIYKQILDCYRLSGVSNLFSTFKDEIPSEEKCKEQIRASNIDGLFSEFIDNIFNNKSKELAFWFGDDNLETNNPDIELYQRLITELINMGFNNQLEQAKSVYKITRENSPLLVLAIKFYSSADYNHMQYLENERMVGLKILGHTYDFTKSIRTKPGSRKHRDQTKRFKKDGFTLCHDEKIVKVATRWYYSRVKYSGPKEFCDKMKCKEFTFDPSNISNEIKPCDEAMGYPRKD